MFQRCTVCGKVNQSEREPAEAVCQLCGGVLRSLTATEKARLDHYSRLHVQAVAPAVLVAALCAVAVEAIPLA